TVLVATTVAASSPLVVHAQSAPARAEAAGAEPIAIAPSAAEVPASALATVRRLLDAGAQDVDAPDRDGTPALHWVVRLGDADLVARLLAAGAKVDAVDRHGVTPLSVAIGAGDAALVRRLLGA